MTKQWSTFLCTYIVYCVNSELCTSVNWLWDSLLTNHHDLKSSAVLTHAHWARRALAQGPHANLRKLCTACFFLMFEHSFCWKYQYNEYKAYSKYIPNFIDLYSFIPESCCVDMGPKVMLCSRAYNAVKTVLVKRTYMYMYN